MVEQTLRLMPVGDGHAVTAIACGDERVDRLPRDCGGFVAPQQAAPDARAGAVTRAGFLGHIDACVRHLAAWLGSLHGDPGLVPAPETPAVESARVQLWRWLHSDDARLDDGTPIDFALFDAAIQRVGERLPRRGLPGQDSVLQAAWLLAELTHARTLAESVMLPAPARAI